MSQVTGGASSHTPLPSPLSSLVSSLSFPLFPFPPSPPSPLLCLLTQMSISSAGSPCAVPGLGSGAYMEAIYSRASLPSFLPISPHPSFLHPTSLSPPSLGPIAWMSCFTDPECKQTLQLKCHWYSSTGVHTHNHTHTRTCVYLCVFII